MAGSISLWYRRRFNLTMNDAYFLALTPLDILTEYHAHLYDDLYSQGKLDGLNEDDDFDLDALLASMDEGNDGNIQNKINDTLNDDWGNDTPSTEWEDVIDEC